MMGGFGGGFLGALFARMNMDVSNWEQGAQQVSEDLDRLDREVSEKTERIAQQFEEAGRSMQNMGKNMSRFVTVPLAGAGAALGAASMEAAKYADMIDKMSIRSEIGREQLQELYFVTDQLGITFSTVERALDSFRRRLIRMEDPTGRYAQYMNEIGVEVLDAEGNMRSMNDLFNDMIIGLAGMENETRRGALATQLLGRRASALTPLIDAGAESIEELTEMAHELGIVMGDETIDDLVAFRDEMAQVRQGAQAAMREFGMILVPVLRNDVLPLLRDDLVPAVRSVAEWFTDLDDSTKRTVVAIGALAAAAGPALMVIGQMSLGVGALVRATVALTGSTGALATAKGALTRAIQASHRAIQVHPIGAFMTVVAAATAGMWAWHRATQSTVSIQERANAQVDDQRARIQALTSIIENDNAAQSRRKEAIEELNRMIPDYNAKLSEEGELIGHNTKAIDNYLEKQRERIALQIYEEELVQIKKDIIEAERELDAAAERGQRQMERTNHIAWETNEAYEQQWNRIHRLREEYNSLENEMLNFLDANEQAESSTRAASLVTFDLYENIRRLNQEGGLPTMGENVEAVEAPVRDLTKVITELEDGLRGIENQFFSFDDQMERIETTIAQMSHTSFPGVSQAIIDMEQQIGRARVRNDMLGESFDLTRAKLGIYTQTFNALIEAGYEGHEITGRLADRIIDLQDSMDKGTEGAEIYSQVISRSFSQMASTLGEAVATTEASSKAIVDTLFNAMQQIIQMKFTEALASVFTSSVRVGGILGLGAALAGMAALRSLWSSHVESEANKVQGLASGGEVVRPGIFEVGERGRELVHLPAGAAVTPAQARTRGRRDKLEGSIRLTKGELLIAVQEAERHNKSNY